MSSQSTPIDQLNALNSRSLHKHTVMTTITSLFRKAHNPPPPPAPTRNQSSATAATTGSSTGKTLHHKGIVEERDLGMSPVATNDIQASTSSLTELSQLRNAGASPFAGGVEGGVNYQTLHWWQAGMLMVAETISLGILALPAALAVLGMVPGVVLLLLLGALASYAGLVIGQFKSVHPSIHSMADAGNILLGRVGREVLELGQIFFLITIMASHVVTFGIMMNVLTNHGTCTIVFLASGAILSFVLNLPRKLGNMYWLSAVSFLSIVSAVIITMTAVALDDNHTVVSPVEPVHLWPAPGLTFTEVFGAVANMCFSYSGHVAFFGFISELRSAHDFPKALAFLQISDISMYLTTSVVIYYYIGDHVQTPALDSVSPLLRKVAYGIAIPTIVIAGVVNGAVAIKYVYVRLLRERKGDVMHQNTWRARGIWMGLTFVGWLAAWIVAESVPVLDDLLGLSASLFASWFTFGLPGLFWMSLNVERKGWWWVKKGRWGWRKWLLLGLNLGLVIAGAVVCGIGLYSSIKNIKESTNTDKPFTCKAKSQRKEL